MTTLSDLRTYVARDLRDTGNDTWDVAEIDDYINRGIDELADVYPKEIVSTFATVTTGTYSYGLGTFTNLYRLDVYNSAGTHQSTVTRGTGDHPDAGWEVHAGNVWLPSGMPLTTGDRLRGFGYGRYIQLAASSATTDLDASGINAVRVFAAAEAIAALVPDRAAFQQWQSNSNGTDVTALGADTIAARAQGRWERERRRLRRMRK